MYSTAKVFTQAALAGGKPCRKAVTNTGQHNQKKCGQTSMPRVGFDLTIPVFWRAKGFLALDRAATVIGLIQFRNTKRI
jgi:hypothetical protein